MKSLKNKNSEKASQWTWKEKSQLAIEWLGKSASIRQAEKQLIAQIMDGIIYQGWQVRKNHDNHPAQSQGNKKKNSNDKSSGYFWSASQAINSAYIISHDSLQEHYLLYRNWRHDWVLQVKKSWRNKHTEHLLEEYSSLQFNQLEKLLACFHL